MLDLTLVVGAVSLWIYIALRGAKALRELDDETEEQRTARKWKALRIRVARRDSRK